MDPDGRTAIVTGAARGIGAAIARELHAAGARVVLADLDGDGARSVAEELESRRPGSALGIGVDVATAAGNRTLVETARAAFGDIDIFVANAGIAAGTDLGSPESEWERSFAVNVHAHRWAAEILVPEWLERGEGYFCVTASAAGLLAQIGSAPYSVTKHAAVAFAEWLAITYGDRGIGVSCLCPQGVNTAMINASTADTAGRAAGDVVRAAGAVLEPEEVALRLVEAVRAGRFLVLPHPEVHDYEVRRATDRERWLHGMRKLQAMFASRTER
jgi:NAD(P)-dependent dehydrogenase (short-subunit alcohol dehydrogenase family)